MSEAFDTEAEAQALLEANPNTQIMGDIRVRKELQLVLNEQVSA